MKNFEELKVEELKDVNGGLGWGDVAAAGGGLIGELIGGPLGAAGGALAGEALYDALTK